ncbi:MAG: HAD-IC family P-type ATPase, partial [Sphaerochaetaceae bacterium]|nr:HAD-IC family P-type ATPase [Sphaerochaetaceae bacterium]
SAVSIDESFGSLLPQQKVEKLNDLKKEGLITYVGDGINDAPVLVNANVGIAMGGIGSHSAIEASDIVILNDDLEKIPLAISISKKTILLAKENIVFALGIKVLFLLLGALGLIGMSLAVFADVGVALLCVLNSMRTLK